MQTEITLDGWFTGSVTAHPDRIALEVAGRALTYRELSDAADTVARRILAATGGRRPRRVGLLAARTVDSYAGYLAVQRLSATVVPLNPIFPADRNAAIARAGELDLALVQGDAPALPVPVLALDRPGAEAETALPPPEADPDAVAYILFTSGSTGAPKGVPVRHRNVAAYVRHVIARYRTGPGSRLSQTFDLTFDPSVFDMFAAWGSGATLVVPSRSDLLAPARFVAAKRITHWFSVPSIVSLADRLHGLAPGSMPDLRWSLFAGEALTLAQARAWQAAAPASTVENIYGPTELTVTCTEYRLPADPHGWPVTSNGTVPIGTVYPHLEHAVIGPDGRPGDEGELCIRGPQRFAGYLDPAQNTGRFRAPDDFAPAENPIGERHWYRTGDRVRVEDGALVHLGRLDHQLKIRGYRVELGEIESVLRRQPGVRDAFVVPVTAADGEIDLVGSYSGARADEDGLLDALRTELAPYMVPRRLAWRQDWPLNVNGKVDRAALTEQLAGQRADQPAGVPA